MTTRHPQSRWKLSAPWTAQNAAHRALENAAAFSTSSNRHHHPICLQAGNDLK